MKIAIFSIVGALIVGPAIFLLTIQSLNIFLTNKTQVAEAQTRSTQIPTDIRNLSNERVHDLNVASAIVIQIVDFNTIKVLLDDGMEEINLIGISKNDLCEDPIVNSAMQNLILGKKVYMIEDKNYPAAAIPYRYVFSDELVFLNQELIKQGIARAERNNNYLYREDFIKSEGNYTQCQIKIVNKTTPTTVQKTQADNLYSKLLVTATPIPTKAPSPTASPTPNQQEIVQNTNISSGTKPSSLNPELLFVMINNHRASIGKTPYEKDGALCSLAVARGPELYDEIFVNYNVHAGLTKRNLPYWITENMAHYDTEEKVFNWWMNSSLHRRAIEGDYKYSCGECYGNSCAQLFTSYVPK